MKLLEKDIRKEFENYSPPTWMIETIQKIGKTYAKKIIDECAKAAVCGFDKHSVKEGEDCFEKVRGKEIHSDEYQYGDFGILPPISVDETSILNIKNKI
ncbi:MAG: hypothetical protein GY775_16695 [Candidatus Scalindua sp.]|nr:hypothetical protein [Candidatus Scalindua sp.]